MGTKMDIKKNNGFTILETTLVLAISSLLLILMLTGITLAVQQQRFSDSVNGSQSFIQQQFNYTQNTTNDRPLGACDATNPGAPSADAQDVRGSSDCLIIGKLLELKASAGDDESHIIAYDVIGADVDVESDLYRGLSDLELINSIKPTVIEPNKTDYPVPWGAHLSNIKDSDSVSTGSDVRYVALLRSPRSGVIHIYKISSPLAVQELALPQSLTASIQEIDTSVKMCLSSIDLVNYGAMLEIMPSGSQDGVVAHFDDGSQEAYGCV